MKSRGVVIGLSVAIVVLGLVLVFLAFGTPQAPVKASDESVQANASGGDGPLADGADPGSVTTSGEVPPPDPSSPLAIEIPGCVCHSDDPALVEEHAGYRMNQCFGCHAGGMPEMGG